uniref:Uncharacterized protein n=1 Tax=Rhizophora mucronata TaxID=61149 RepID=A0A2P2QRJ7_RHIMU
MSGIYILWPTVLSEKTLFQAGQRKHKKNSKMA